MAKHTAKQERPALDVTRRGAFVCGGRLAVRTPGVHPGNVSSNLAPRAIISGTVIVGAMAAPSRPPRDWAPRYPTVCNITASARICTARSLNVSDWARHEYPSPRQAD